VDRERASARERWEGTERGGKGERERER